VNYAQSHEANCALHRKVPSGVIFIAERAKIFPKYFSAEG
jgi:hypothetical protein